MLAGEAGGVVTGMHLKATTGITVAREPRRARSPGDLIRVGQDAVGRAQQQAHGGGPKGGGDLLWGLEARRHAEERLGVRRLRSRVSNNMRGA